MSANLTPGPWRAADYMARAELIEGPNGQQLAMRQDDASVADMLVMAAAPELLEALQRAGNSAGFQYMTLETRDAINAAIAKATGAA